jgi:hypothetical protein
MSSTAVDGCAVPSSNVSERHHHHAHVSSFRRSSLLAVYAWGKSETVESEPSKSCLLLCCRTS